MGKKQTTLVIPYGDKEVTGDVMRTMAPLASYGVGLTDIVGIATESALYPRQKTVVEHVMDHIDPNHFDQSHDEIDDGYIYANGQRVEYGVFQELLTDAVCCVYDRVEAYVAPTVNCAGKTVVTKGTFCKEGTDRIFVNVEIDDDVV